MTDRDILKDNGWNIENSYACLPDLFFTRQSPTAVRAPKLMLFNEPLAIELGLNVEKLQSLEGIEVFAGNRVPEAAIPISQAYAGHQFGHFTMLGDGRAVLLGEQISPSGQRYDIQLKGSGKTPYSRGGDGRAALGPMLREYIISEAMHGLGIPTTRSLAVVTTGEAVIRETQQPGAIMTRVAASHIRVGTFQYVAQWGTVEELRALADYTIRRHYPQIEADENRYQALLQEVIKSQAQLIARWQLVGFIHGVMNTDNMAISGETIDYGPCAFMDAYNPDTVFSSIDTFGRYAYGKQPNIANWNLARFAETLLPLLQEDQTIAVEMAQEMVSEFAALYHKYWLDGMRAKLGLINEEQQDEALIESLLLLMQKHNADYTNTFRGLTLGKMEDSTLFGTQEFEQWKVKWKERVARQQQPQASIEQLMRNSNPSIIPRNHRVEEALEAAVKQGDYSVINRYLAVLSNPYIYSNEQTDYCKVSELPGKPYRTFCGT